jgi:hypothetical protein
LMIVFVQDHLRRCRAMNDQAAINNAAIIKE